MNKFPTPNELSLMKASKFKILLSGLIENGSSGISLYSFYKEESEYFDLENFGIKKPMLNTKMIQVEMDDNYFLLSMFKYFTTISPIGCVFESDHVSAIKVGKNWIYRYNDSNSIVFPYYLRSRIISTMVNSSKFAEYVYQFSLSHSKFRIEYYMEYISKNKYRAEPKFVVTSELKKYQAVVITNNINSNKSEDTTESETFTNDEINFIREETFRRISRFTTVELAFNSVIKDLEEFNSILSTTPRTI